VGKELCFVITPISQTSRHSEKYWEDNFKLFLKPIIERSGVFKAQRSEALRGDILNSIIKSIAVAKVVVADLTDLNPNVFWELGVRQSFKNGTITIAEVGSSIPFDISKKGVLMYYPEDHIKNSIFEDTLQMALQDIIANPDSSDSQVLETMSGRGSLYEIFQKQELMRRVDGLIDESTTNSTIAKVLLNRLEKENNVQHLRFQSCSIELLITHRYLEQPETFYQKAARMLMSIEYQNSNLQIYGNNLKVFKRCYSSNEDDWIKKYKETTTQTWTDFTKELGEIKQKLEDSS
jgi:hypothetical protein